MKCLRFLCAFVCVAVLSVASADDPPQKLPVTGTITVYVMDLFGSPLAGFDASYFVQGGIPSLTRTDQDGNFTITGLELDDIFSFTAADEVWMPNGWYDQKYQGAWTYYLYMIPSGF